MKLNFRKYLLEQNEWEELTAQEKERVKSFADAKVVKYFKELTPSYKVRKNGIWKDTNGVDRVKWQKKLTTAPTPPQSDLQKYVGSYDGGSLLPYFIIELKNDKLYGSGTVKDKEFGNIELIPVSENKFKAKISGVDFEINFNVKDNSVTGGVAVGTLLGVSQSITFTKKSSTPTPPKPDEPKKEDKSVWSCITKFNQEYNQFDLVDEGDYRYEIVDYPHNGQDTVFMYYKDGSAVWAYLKDKKPLLKGKWECKGDKGYLIRWSDGQISRYGTKEADLGGQPKKDAEITTENLCPNGYKEGCVSKNDIFGKKKALKACSKCDLVKEVQENPEIKARIFRLQKEAGQPEKTDNVFGPIMLAAIKEFQSSHGINPTGNVGELTLTKINPIQAKQFYLDRGGKKFQSRDNNGGAVDYLKALQIKDDFDEADGVLYWMVAQGTKDKNAKCSAYIKSVERGYWESTHYYRENKCSEISGFPSFEELSNKFGSKNVDWTPKTDVKNEPVINKTDVKTTNKPEVKPIYRRSSRQVLSPDEEL